MIERKKKRNKERHSGRRKQEKDDQKTGIGRKKAKGRQRTKSQMAF